MKLIMVIILLIIMIFVLKRQVFAGEFGFKAKYKSFFIEVDEPTWLNHSCPVSLGVSWKGLSISYGILYSDLWISYGDRFTIDYTLNHSPVSPYFTVIGEYYRRVNEGGVSIAEGVEIECNNQLSLRTGIVNGWLTGEPTYQLSFVIKVN